MDFGTATTCIATVPPGADMQPQVVSIDQTLPFVNSLVWVSHPGDAKPIVPSRSRLGRCPLALFDEARIVFGDYWTQRIKAQEEGHTWHDWRNEKREQSMLLSYFKPELADTPRPRSELVADTIVSNFDQLRQSEDITIYYASRLVANPAPDTDDLVAATAAIIRGAVEKSYAKYGQVELLLMGVPSHQALVDDTEARQAAKRRLEAVELAGIARDFGTTDFRVELFGEAQAAGYGIDIDTAGSEAHAIIVDVGAGTTDLALVPYRRDRGRRLVAQDPIAHHSVRFAGRNLNEAIALGLQQNERMRDAYRTMDERSWQILMDDDIELIKRSLTNETKNFKIGFHRYAAASDNGQWENPRRRALRRTAFLDLSLNSGEIRIEVQKACRHWRIGIISFLERAKAQLGSRDPIAIQMVGGAFKFEPLQQALKAALRAAGLESVPLRYRHEGNESQTVVARGLARKAMLFE